MATDKHIDIRLTQAQANLILIGLEDLHFAAMGTAVGAAEIEELMDMIMDAGLDAGFGDVQT
jgi:hypothetical protein